MDDYKAAIENIALKRKIETGFEFAAHQLRRMSERYPGEFPLFTRQGKWICQDHTGTHWTEGFIGGEMWLIYQATGQEWFRQQAELAARRIEPRKRDRRVHDLGFLFWPTWKRWYDLTGDRAKNDVVIEAGRTLAGRNQAAGGYLCSFRGPESLYIDIMMNVGLVFYAAQQEQDERLEQTAIQHCLTTRRWLVRGDGSTAHEGIFDPQTGAFLRQSTRQGWRADSTWARGLAWALAGFGEAYQFSADGRFLQTARLIADFYLEHTPSGAIPPNDWDEPQPEFAHESSAAAIAVCGLLQLARLEADDQRQQRYRQAALQTLDTLLSPQFLADETPGWEGILKHAIYHLPERAGVDESVIWGDYYLLNAMHQVMEGTSTA